MEVFERSTDTPSAERRCSVAIGNFDGIHLGHQALLRTTVAEASRTGAVPAVLTFFPHPSRILSPDRPFKYLSTPEEKCQLLERAGVGILWVVPFTRELAALSPHDFFERFVRQGLKAASLHVGEGFGFGKARAGNVRTLGDFCRADSIVLKVEQPLCWDNERISSSRIRSLLGEGNLEKANRLLGYPYLVSGNVAHGAKRGAQIGIRTANLRVKEDKLLPPNGVYITRSRLGGKTYPSVTNVGTRPTFDPKSTDVLTETHLLGAAGEFYGERLELEFLSFIRAERVFPTKEALLAQIQKDIEAAERWAKG